MSTAGIAIPSQSKRPVHAVSKNQTDFTLRRTEPGGPYTLVITGNAEWIGASCREVAATFGLGGYPGVTGAPPNPGLTPVRRPMSAATKAKMAAAQRKRQADLKASQGETGEVPTPAAAKTRTRARRKQPKVIGAGAGGGSA
jgi:hypothetical protein